MKWGLHFNLIGLKQEIKDLENQSIQPMFWEDMDKSQKVLQKIKRLQEKVKSHEKVKSLWEDLTVLVEVAIEEKDNSVLKEVSTGCSYLKKELQKLKIEILLSGKYDKNNAIIALHAGAGGTEAQDWVSMLLRMYTRWAESRGYSVETLDFLAGDEAGVKSATILLKGNNAYGYSKCEKGVHRLVRISPFDASGRRHTSFASIDVMPEIDDDVEIDINTEDLRIDTYRASGAGGQHVNKTESAIRITHIPTGIVVQCQNERSQHQNKDVALKILKSKLLELKEEEQQQHIDELKGVQKEIAWGSQIRSYVFHPYNLVKDHRTNYEMGNINAVMDGDLDNFINEYLKMISSKNI